MEFQFQQALAELERAAEVSSAPSVTLEERRAAEEVILAFRKSKDAVDLCKYILERTQSEHLRFDAAQVLRDSVLAVWERFSQTDGPTILAQQLINLMFTTNISYAVGRRLASVVALIVKHQAIERNGQERKELVHHLISNIATTGYSFMVTTTIMESVVAEHQFLSASMKADHFFSFEAHFASKKNFENYELLLIFEACLQYLNSYEGGRENELDRILRLVEMILFWCFTNTNLPQRIMVVVENDLYPVFKPPTTWDRIVTNAAFENIFFDLHLKVRGQETLVARTMQFISQIFSMSGPLFPGRNSRVALLGRLLPRFIQFLELPSKSPREILGLSDVVRKVLLFHRMATLTSIDQSVLEKFFYVAGNFTCTVLQEAVVEDSKSYVDDRVLRESSTRLLEAWTNVLAEPEDAPNCIMPISKAVFSTYVHGRLSPPFGFRPQIIDEDDEDDIADDVRFRDQLQTLGLFGRAAVEHSLELLSTIFSQLIVRFEEYVPTTGLRAVGTELYEDMHWALLITGHFLAYEAEGETNLIPKEIVQCSLKANADPQLNFLCIEKAMSAQPLPEGNVDPVIKLISLVLVLNEYERRLVEGTLIEFISPEVSKNIAWFLSRIAGVYYLYSETQYAEMSVSFQDFWGKNGRVAGIFLDSLLLRIRNHIQGNTGEEAVQVEAVELLESLTNSEEKARRALLSPQFAPLVQLINSIGPNKRDIPCEIYQKAIKSLMVVGNLSATEYWSQILTPLSHRFSNFFAMATSDKHREDVRLELTFLISAYIGVVSSTNSRVAFDLFQRIVPLRGNVASILSAYSNYTDLVQLCLTFMTEVGKRFLSYLPMEHAIEVYQESVNVTKAYAIHAYGRVSAEKDAEDEKITDLILLFELMISLLTKDLLDLSPDVNEEGREPPRVTGTEVSVSCLTVILPLLNKSHFQYPSLSDKYFRLITYLSELDSGILLSMESGTFNSLMETVSLALKSSNPDSFNHCCEFITCLANQISRNNLRGSESSEMVKAFLRVFFHMALTMALAKDSLPAISNAIFALISAYKETYEEIAREIIASGGARVEQLQKAFLELTGGNLNMVAGGDRQSRLAFRTRLEAFIHAVRSNLDA